MVAVGISSCAGSARRAPLKAEWALRWLRLRPFFHVLPPRGTFCRRIHGRAAQLVGAFACRKGKLTKSPFSLKWSLANDCENSVRELFLKFSRRVPRNVIVLPCIEMKIVKGAFSTTPNYRYI
jgi:hypothetical protein